MPDDWEHVKRFPLAAVLGDAAPSQVPVVIGIHWYEEFDSPVRDARSGEMIVAPKGPRSLTRVRGGHCVCLEPGGQPDAEANWTFYDQGQEGACVGFGWSRCMTLLNKGQDYAARWLWDRAKEVDEWPQTNPGDTQGTSVRAAGNVLRSSGHVDWRASMNGDDATARKGYTPDQADGIVAYRWAASVDEVHAVLGDDRGDALGAVRFLNSWGHRYPHRTYMPDDVLDRLMAEGGEVAVPTDR